MKNPERKSFADIQEFRDYARDAAGLVYYHVFRGAPDPRMIDALAGRGPDEALVLLDLDEDRGFLAGTDVTVDITPERVFITMKMAERPGLGAWAKGTSVDFVADPDDVAALVAGARRFAFPPNRAATMGREGAGATA